MSKQEVQPEIYTQVRMSVESDSLEKKILLGKIRISKPKAKKLSKSQTIQNPITPKLSLYSQLNSTTIIIQTYYDRFIISNSNQIKHFWDILMELILIYNLITTLYFLAYCHPSKDLIAVDIFCWCLFIINIFITMITEQLDKRGFPIRYFKHILKIYFEQWLFVDIISIIPLGFFGYYEAEYLLRMFRLLKLPSIIDFADGVGLGYLLTYFNYGKTDKKGRVRYSFIFKIIASIIKLVISIIFIIYFLGCFWHWFQKIVKNKEHSLGITGDDSSFEKYFGLENEENKNVALRSSYFMLTTIATIGYGDFLPRNVYEMACISMIMLFGVTLFAFISGNVNSAVTFYSELSSGVDYLGNLNIWLNSVEEIRGSIPLKLKKEVLSHFKYYFLKDRLKSLAKNYWETDAPKDLIAQNQPYVELLTEEEYFSILDSLFNDVQFLFRNYTSEEECFYSMIPHFQPRLFLESEVICGENEDFSEIYFILKGQVLVGKIIDFVFCDYLHFEKGDVIGDFSALTDRLNIYHYFSKSITDTFIIPRLVFSTILNNFFPKTRSHILGNAAKREHELKKIDTSVQKYNSSLITSRLRHIAKTVMKKPSEHTDEDINLKVLEAVNSSEKLRNGFYKLNSCIDEINKIHKAPFLNVDLLGLDN
ncbi:hypothetical protein SteCoe_26094 [Stentor coeruleus]|uniref:Cyclic nucleotide-binding domain-containing protein n=1 Tax=Stentor coeruleus TaxID=5963 RepID=A0A1R2BDP1_9CILI|nr:hypothetical protein SteCoe_26094 [Stentor coeruleus]